MTKTLFFGFGILAATVFASSNSFHMTLTQDSNIEGKILKAGDYKVTLENGNAIIKQGKQTIEVPAHEESEASKYSSTSLVYQNDDKLSEVRFGGTKTKIVFEGDSPMHAGQ